MNNQAKCPIRMLEKARELADQVQMMRELGSDFTPEAWPDLWYVQIVAIIRHEYTNYDDLLMQLPNCLDYWNEHHGADCPEEAHEGPCPLLEEAHDIIQHAANAVAHAAYSEWRKGKRS